jgi:hypothetical protein
MVRFARINRWALALVVALAALAMTFSAAFAAPADGRGKPEGKPGRGARLEATYKVEQARLKVQNERLGRAGEYATKIDAVIARLKSKGKDTAALDQAVAAFRTAIGQARAEWQAASDVLATHAGFDAAGKVTNADQARATLESAHGHMQKVHEVMRAAYTSLRDALKAYRKAHREATPPPTPAEP